MPAGSPGKLADHGAITGLECARDHHQPLLAGHRGEAVGRLGERKAGALGQCRRHLPCVAGLGVQPGAHRGAPDRQRPDQGARQALRADPEVLQGALGLRAPVPIRRYLDPAHAVPLDARAHDPPLLVRPPTRHRRNQTQVANLGSARPSGRADPRTRRSRESGIKEPAAGRRTILRRFVEDFTGNGLWYALGGSTGRRCAGEAAIEGAAGVRLPAFDPGPSSSRHAAIGYRARLAGKRPPSIRDDP